MKRARGKCDPGSVNATESFAREDAARSGAGVFSLTGTAPAPPYAGPLRSRFFTPGGAPRNTVREKRQHHRAALDVPVSVRGTAGGSWSARSQDVSIGGMFLSAVEAPGIGLEVKLEFELPGLGSVELPAFVRWTKDGGFGVQFGLLGARETHAIGKLVRGGSYPGV